MSLGISVEMSSETLITNKSRRFGTILAFTAAGMLSGILTVTAVIYLDPVDPFVGIIFGTTVAVSLALRQRMWPAGRIIALIASSVMAYFAAIWSPGLITELLRSLRILETASSFDVFSPAIFSIAGFVGAFVIMLAVLLLFFQEKGWRAPAKASALALPGALLGLISSLASASIQEMAAQWLTLSQSWGPRPGQFYSAYLIWQTGMAFVIAALLPLAAPVPSLSKNSAPAAGSPMKLSIGGKIFVACMLAGTVVLGFFEGQDLYRTRQDQHHAEKSQGH